MHTLTCWMLVFWPIPEVASGFSEGLLERQRKQGRLEQSKKFKCKDTTTTWLFSQQWRREMLNMRYDNDAIFITTSPYLQPRPKAVPTLSDSSTAARVLNTTPPGPSRPSSQSRQSSPARPNIVQPDVSERAVRAFIRRVLCPDAHAGAAEQRPIDELLPPLTSSNDIDLQLYAIIAIVIKELVYSWYGKITPDQGFVEEVVKIIAHCTRAIEGRLRRVDLEQLIFDEIPELIENHVRCKCQ